MIHASHTKKDLIELIECFELYEIDDYRDMSKSELKEDLWDYVKGLKYIKTDQEIFFVDDVGDLLRYLNNPSPKQLLSAPALELVTNTSKNIIFYCRTCSHCIAASNYTCIDEIIEDAIDISKYGDLPIVRRALRLLNEDIKVSVPIEPVLTKRVKKKLYRADLLKAQNMGKLKVNNGKFVVTFDED